MNHEEVVRKIGVRKDSLRKNWKKNLKFLEYINDERRLGKWTGRIDKREIGRKQRANYRINFCKLLAERGQGEIVKNQMLSRATKYRKWWRTITVRVSKACKRCWLIFLLDLLNLLGDTAINWYQFFLKNVLVKYETFLLYRERGEGLGKGNEVRKNYSGYMVGDVCHKP